MKAVIGALLLLSLATACGESDDAYELSFTCASSPSANDACPGQEPCPEVPLGAGGCETLPGLFGHDEMEVDVGRPLGCVVSLPYANPYYHEQQTCSCHEAPSGGGASWVCPI